MFENSPQPLTSDQISHHDTEESVMTERNYTWTLAALEYIVVFLTLCENAQQKLF